MFDIFAAVVRMIAPPHLAESIIGDLHERRNRPSFHADAVRSLLSLLLYSAQEAVRQNWIVALMAAVVTCALCDVTIPLWSAIGLDGAVYHVLRLLLIGLVLGSVRRASALSCTLLLVLIASSNLVIDERETQSFSAVLSTGTYYATLLTDGAAMACSLAALRLIQLVRAGAR